MADVRALIRRLGEMDTCVLSDALDALGLPGAVSGIGPMWPCGRVAGRVVTVELGPAASGDGQPATAQTPVHLGARAIAGAEPGDVIVVDNRAGLATGGAGWGGLLSLAAKLQEVAGVVVYGLCRDVDDVADVGLPYYAQLATPRTARRRVVEVATNGPLTFAEVRVEPGDLVLADSSGVVFIGVAIAEEVLTKAEELLAREAEMSAQLRAGTTVTDVLAGNYETMLDSTTKAKDH